MGGAVIVKSGHRKLKTSNRVLLLLSLICAVPVNAEIYKWLDEEGHAHFGDCPPAGQNVSPVEIAPGPTPEQIREAKERDLQVQEQLRELESDQSRMRVPTRAPGSTGACPALQRDVLRMLWVLDVARDRTCTSRRISHTEMVEVIRGAEPRVVERWTIKRCGRRVDYLVTFTTAPEGGTLFSIKVEP